MQDVMFLRKPLSPLAGLLIALIILAACVSPPSAPPAVPASAGSSDAPVDAPAPVVQGADEGLPHSSAIVTNDLELEETDMPQHSEPVTGSIKPGYVTALEAAYGAPSQAGFGSAVFYEPVKTADGLDQAALAKYRFFVGDLWDRYGEEAWMGPWKQVYTRQTGAKPDIVAELRGIADRDARQSVTMILDNVDDAQNARAALAAAFDDPAVTELAAYTLGDGAAMAGILVAGRRDDGAGTFLVFLLD